MADDRRSDKGNRREAYRDRRNSKYARDKFDAAVDEGLDLFGIDADAANMTTHRIATINAFKDGMRQAIRKGLRP